MEMSQRKKTIYENAVYSMSLYIAYLSERSVDFYNYYWKDNTYVFQDVLGVDGAVSFSPEDGIAIGVLRDNNMFVDDFITCYKQSNSLLEYIFDDDVQKELFKKALVYLSVDYSMFSDTQGNGPLITSIVRIDNNGTFDISETLKMGNEHGFFFNALCSPESDEIENYLAEDLELDNIQVDFANKLFEKKVNGSNASIINDPFWDTCVNADIVKDAIYRFGIDI